MGERPLPRLIELRTDKLGTTTYRPLNLGGPMTDPQVQQAVGKIGEPGAWRPMADLAGMHFQPPLQNQLAPSSVIFLAYAPIQAHDPAEQSQLDALNTASDPPQEFSIGTTGSSSTRPSTNSRVNLHRYPQLRSL